MAVSYHLGTAIADSSATGISGSGLKQGAAGTFISSPAAYLFAITTSLN